MLQYCRNCLRIISRAGLNSLAGRTFDTSVLQVCFWELGTLSKHQNSIKLGSCSCHSDGFRPASRSLKFKVSCVWGIAGRLPPRAPAKKYFTNALANQFHRCLMLFLIGRQSLDFDEDSEIIHSVSRAPHRENGVSLYDVSDNIDLSDNRERSDENFDAITIS